MRRLAACLKGGYGSTADVIDGKLVLSFTDAIRPVLWQMDLTSVKTSALEMVDGPEAGQFGLVLRAPKGEVQDIALFSTRDAALEALVTVRNALSRAHGQIRPVLPAPDGTGNVAPPSGYVPGWQGKADAHQTAMKWIGGLAGLVILAILLNMLWSLSPRPPSSIATVAPSSSESQGFRSPQETTGEPVSADDFLRAQ
ncbi:MAG: hypothetical protein H6862_00570 [Rhodospirillales bacterium]|nr:hypothetical protein [Rhodospirillales bacterium]